MDMILKISATIIFVAVINILIKSLQPGISVLISLIGVLFVFMTIAPEVVKVIDITKTYVESFQLGAVVKITGIAFIAGITADICRGAGENALAIGAELAGKISVIAITLPLAVTLLEMITTLI